MASRRNDHIRHTVIPFPGKSGQMGGVNNSGTITTNGGDVIGGDKIIYSTSGAPDTTKPIRSRVAQFLDSGEFAEMNNRPDASDPNISHREFEVVVGLGAISVLALLISLTYFIWGPEFNGWLWWLGFLFFGFWFVWGSILLLVAIFAGFNPTPPQRKAVGIVEKSYVNCATKDTPSLGYFEVVTITEHNDKQMFRAEKDLARTLSVGDIGIVIFERNILYSFWRSKGFSG